MALDDVADRQALRDGVAVVVLEVLARAVLLEDHGQRAGVRVGPVLHEALHQREIVRKDLLRIRQRLGDAQRNRDLVDLEVGVGRNHGAPAEVDALAAEVAAEAAVLALEALGEALDRLLRALRRQVPRHAGVH